MRPSTATGPFKVYRDAFLRSLAAENRSPRTLQTYGEAVELFEPFVPAKGIAIAALVAMGTKDRLRIHVQGALNHGATAEEIHEVILTMMIYAGHARATEAVEVARQVFQAANAD